ncbi:hypothetical protein [Arthrobacter glacialis]|uniref:hypothetical protein n=1 Tax=Arthrobacter glacialis TaxID=1664 RepID=UPI000CD3FDEC|nr:hypothetical protein [Arthrobacter glacialis]POH58258.1 hypothetical protein CVS28_12510 [Arthrobacter glacialis]
MEQAAASTLTGLFAQLGVAGLVLAILIAGAGWYLKASKDLRTEKRDVITDLREDIHKLTVERDALKEALLDCRFPNRNGGVNNEQA